MHIENSQKYQNILLRMNFSGAIEDILHALRVLNTPKNLDKLTAYYHYYRSHKPISMYRSLELAYLIDDLDTQNRDTSLTAKNLIVTLEVFLLQNDSFSKDIRNIIKLYIPASITTSNNAAVSAYMINQSKTNNYNALVAFLSPDIEAAKTLTISKLKVN